ncbi:hypothetical protein, partial [Candidatus Avelusimicrobium faecicola]|uniref:hypothetical protein n=1 Tax=Candidatus Avelusimicrobium faecicola TaxID=3416205 RepID=UPI003D0C164B
GFYGEITGAHTFPAFNGAKRACPNHKQKTRLSAFFDCGSNPPRKAPSCAFNGAERACTLRKSTQQKTRLSAFFDCGSNPHRKAPSCAFNGVERACPNHKQKNPPFGGF